MFEPSIFTNARDWVTVDNRYVFDSAKDDLSKYYFQTDLNPPIMYDQPTDYHSSGAIWAQGIGFVHPPLPVGKHTLVLHSELPPWGAVYDNTWTITVKP